MKISANECDSGTNYLYTFPTSQRANFVLITETGQSLMYMGGPCGRDVTHMQLMCCVGLSHSCETLQQVVNTASN